MSDLIVGRSDRERGATAAEIELPDASLSYYPAFLSLEQKTELNHWLTAHLNWRQADIQLFGRAVREPRLTAWYADAGVDYRYSGRRLQPCAWPEPLEQLRQRISSFTRHPFNALLANCYRHGSDYMGWHSDDERSLGPAPVIASLSLGAERTFVLRRKANHREKYQLELADGSLLIMQGTTQQYWQHALPRRLRVTQPRINLTFRQVFSAA